MLLKEKFNLKGDISETEQEGPSCSLSHQGKISLAAIPTQPHLLAHGQHQAPAMLKVYWDPRATHKPTLSPQLPTGELGLKTWLNDENLLLRKVLFF